MNEKMSRDIVALAGGVGAARFLSGLVEEIDPGRLTSIGNVGDDMEWNGFSISPDLDTVAYTLAGVEDEDRGWGLGGDTFECLAWMAHYGLETWFKLGDRDIATHAYRTLALRQGIALSEVTRRICSGLGVRARLLPASDERLRTQVDTPEGLLDFQVYFVKLRCEPEVRGISFVGADTARPAPGVIEAIREARAVILCPSNPLISIGPILAVRGIREALRETKARVAAISPIVGGRALKGPADRMMRGLGMEATAAAVAEMYRDFVDLFVIDLVDRAERKKVEALGMQVVETQTVMKDRTARRALAREVVSALGL